MSAKSSQRNYGIDLLRMVSMFFVTVLHTLGQGGILSASGFLTPSYETAWFLEIAAYCAVNCYALISGYVTFGTSFKWHRIASLWFQVVFYTLGITWLFSLFSPDLVTQDSWLKAIFPVAHKQYWYFTAYFCMFFFTPFFNMLVESLDSRKASMLISTIIVVFSVYPTFSQADLFGTGGGYSMLWLSALYLIGACIKKFQMQEYLKPWISFAAYFGCVFFTWAFKLIAERQSLAVSGNFFLHYTSPTILFAGIFLLLAFARLSIRKNAAVSAIRLFSPSAFSVYIIHVQSLVWTCFMKGRFVSYAKEPPLILFGLVLATAFGIYILCSCVDLVRRWVFKNLPHNMIRHCAKTFPDFFFAQTIWERK